jgi:hypothetical protein
MRKLIIILFALLFTSSAFAQLELDEAGKQLLDSLKIKYDPNDPDATLKLEQQLKELFLAKYDSAMKVAGNTVIDPNNTEVLKAEILKEFGEGEDTISTDFEFMQEMPILKINLDHPDRRYLTENGFELPANLDVLFVTGNGKAMPVDLNSLITRLSSGNISELYMIFDSEGISEIPNEIGNLKNLRTLGLYGNRISQLPASIGELTQLEAFYIDGNPIKELPKSIGGLKNLKALGIAGTQISTEEQARIQKQLPNCKILAQ